MDLKNKICVGMSANDPYCSEQRRKMEDLTEREKVSKDIKDKCVGTVNKIRTMVQAFDNTYCGKKTNATVDQMCEAIAALDVSIVRELAEMEAYLQEKKVGGSIIRKAKEIINVIRTAVQVTETEYCHNR